MAPIRWEGLHMAKFDVVIERVLAHEGGYVNHPKDPGGATNFGITQRTLTSIRAAQPEAGIKIASANR